MQQICHDCLPPYFVYIKLYIDRGGGKMADVDMAKAQRIGPVRLAPGVSASEVLIFLLIVALTGSVVSFVALMQPFILTELAHIPDAQQGRVAGGLTTLQQIVIMACVGLTGALGDRVGRRLLLICTLIGFALCLVGFSMVGGLAGLVIVRMVYGFASSLHTASVPPKFVEYPDEGSRGKFMALTMIMLNISGMVLVGYVAARLPAWYQAAGFTEIVSGKVALWTAATLAVVLAICARIFMQPDRRAPVASATTGKKKRFAGYAEVLAHAKTNPNFGLLLLTSFVIRTDGAVITSFLALWVVIDAKSHGIGMIEALKIVGVLTAIHSACSITVPLILGPILDRVNRAVVYAASVGIVGVALMLTGFVTDVTSPLLYVVMIFVGIGEAAQTLSQQALFGQEAPPHLRGTAYGMLAVLGTISVIIVSMVGGQLFDTLGPAAPFMLSGGLHIVVLAGGLLVMRYLAGRTRRRALADMPVEAPASI